MSGDSFFFQLFRKFNFFAQSILRYALLLLDGGMEGIIGGFKKKR